MMIHKGPIKKRKIRCNHESIVSAKKWKTSPNARNRTIQCDFIASQSFKPDSHEEYLAIAQSSHTLPTLRLVSTHDALWNKRYRELVDFEFLHGHCDVPQRYPLNKALGKWAHKQKQLLQNKGGIMRADRYTALEKIGFTRSLVPRSKLSWNERYAELVEFRRLNGHCQVPQRYPLNPALGKWVHNQRQALRKQKKYLCQSPN